MNYSILLAGLVLPYFFFFTYFESARLSHKQHKNVFQIALANDPRARADFDDMVKKSQVESGQKDTGDGLLKVKESPFAKSLARSKTQLRPSVLAMSFN